MTRIVVAGASGLIGAKLVRKLTGAGHEVIAPSRTSGVDLLTGDGLAAAVAGADVVVDVTNSPSFDSATAMDFFTRTTARLLDAERTAGVGHHVALSVVGTSCLPSIGYFRAKLAQEKLITESEVPYSVVRATWCFESIDAIANWATQRTTVRLPDALTQPVAADDVAALLAVVAVGDPINCTVDLAGPETFGLAELFDTALGRRGDPRRVNAGAAGRDLGASLRKRSLMPRDGAVIGRVRLADWLATDYLWEDA